MKQENATSSYYTDEKTGNRYQKISESGTDTYYRVNDKGDYLYELKINDKSIYVSEKATLQSVLDDINSSDSIVLSEKNCDRKTDIAGAGDCNFIGTFNIKGGLDIITDHQGSGIKLQDFGKRLQLIYGGREILRFQT